MSRLTTCFVFEKTDTHLFVEERRIELSQAKNSLSSNAHNFLTGCRAVGLVRGVTEK
jgi:hypothetical protein